jgi:CRISPR/Cas system-associated endonuclease Cas3-HD
MARFCWSVFPPKEAALITVHQMSGLASRRTRPGSRQPFAKLRKLHLPVAPNKGERKRSYCCMRIPKRNHIICEKRKKKKVKRNVIRTTVEMLLWRERNNKKYYAASPRK